MRLSKCPNLQKMSELRVMNQINWGQILHCEVWQVYLQTYIATALSIYLQLDLIFVKYKILSCYFNW